MGYRDKPWRPDQPVSARRLDGIRSALERLDKLHAIPPLFLKDDGGGGKVLGVDLGVVAVALATITAVGSNRTGMPPAIVPGGLTVTLMGWDGTATTAATTGVAVNSPWDWASTPPAPGKVCIVMRLFGLWWLLVWDC